MKLSTTHRGRFATVLCGLLFLVLGTFYAGSLFGRYLVVNYLLFEYPLSTNIKASLRQLLHLDHSYSLAEGAQDRWIARCLMPGKRDGFYVDVGSADGTISSNTKLLDELGWKGVCIDPFPAQMDVRCFDSRFSARAARKSPSVRRPNSEVSINRWPRTRPPLRKGVQWSLSPQQSTRSWIGRRLRDTSTI